MALWWRIMGWYDPHPVSAEDVAAVTAAVVFTLKLGKTRQTKLMRRCATPRRRFTARLGGGPHQQGARGKASPVMKGLSLLVIQRDGDFNRRYQLYCQNQLADVFRDVRGGYPRWALARKPVDMSHFPGWYELFAEQASTCFAVYHRPPILDRNLLVKGPHPGDYLYGHSGLFWLAAITDILLNADTNCYLWLQPFLSPWEVEDNQQVDLASVEFAIRVSP